MLFPLPFLFVKLRSTSMADLLRHTTNPPPSFGVDFVSLWVDANIFPWPALCRYLFFSRFNRLLPPPCNLCQTLVQTSSSSFPLRMSVSETVNEYIQ